MSNDRQRGTSDGHSAVGAGGPPVGGLGFGGGAPHALPEEDRIRPIVLLTVLALVIPVLLVVGAAFLVRFSPPVGQFAAVAVLTLEKDSPGIARVLRPILAVRIDGSEQEMWRRLAANDLYSLGILIGAGWSPDISDAQGHSFLRTAVELGNIDAISLLLDRGVDANKKDSDSETPLTVAVKSGNLVMTQLLLSKGATVGETGAGGLRPIDIAAKDAGASICEVLLKAGAEARSPNTLGFVPLDYSVESDNINAVKLFLDRGADPLRIDPDGLNPLLRAVIGKNSELVSLLLKNPEMLETPSVGGRSVKEIANERGLDVHRFPDGRIRVIPLIKFPQQIAEEQAHAAEESLPVEAEPAPRNPILNKPLPTTRSNDGYSNSLPNVDNAPRVINQLPSARIGSAAANRTTLRSVGETKGIWLRKSGGVKLVGVKATVNNVGENPAQNIRVVAALPEGKQLNLKGAKSLKPKEASEYSIDNVGLEFSGNAAIKLELYCDNCETK